MAEGSAFYVRGLRQLFTTALLELPLAHVQWSDCRANACRSGVAVLCLLERAGVLLDAI